MPKHNDHLFCFFSGFAHRVIDLLDYDEHLDRGVVILSCHNKGNHTVFEGDYIQLNGVLFEVIDATGSNFKACSTLELLSNTSIMRAKSGDKLTLGILAEKDLSHDCLWMLQPSAAGQATYIGYSVLEGHLHTLKLDFEASIELAPMIREGCHLGLAGSSLIPKQVVTEGNLLKFSIHCGRETREQSQFNQDLRPGTLVNITEPAEIENRAYTLKL